jgi:uncharacterized membrane protein (DUF106 family)
MYRMYGQIFAPAISALPPSVVVVCRGVMDDKERCMYRMYGQIFAPAISALPPSVVVVCRGAMDGKERCMYGIAQRARKAVRYCTFKI